MHPPYCKCRQDPYNLQAFSLYTLHDPQQARRRLLGREPATFYFVVRSDVFSVVRHGSENRLIRPDRQINRFSVFADVGSGNCQISVRKERLESASCFCDGLAGRHRRRTSCHSGASCLQGEAESTLSPDRNSCSARCSHQKLRASAFVGTRLPRDCRSATYSLPQKGPWKGLQKGFQLIATGHQEVATGHHVKLLPRCGRDPVLSH
jgi:hypothetical protein